VPSTVDLSPLDVAYLILPNVAQRQTIADWLRLCTVIRLLLFAVLCVLPSLGLECTVDAADAFANCLQDNACGSHETAEEKCTCYRNLATCYRDSLGVCVSQQSFIEFQRACVRNAGCALEECNDASPLSASLAAVLVAAVARAVV
jgi:hypothetical protein